MPISTLDFEAFINQVRDASPIEDVVGSDVKLRKAGTHHAAEGDASFVVFPNSGTYKQFGKSRPFANAGEHGDVFTWLVNRHKASDFMDALKTLAQRARIPLPDFGAQSARSMAAVRTRQTALHVCVEWAMAELRASQAAQAYCLGRGWLPETIARYTAVDGETVVGAGLGFTGDGWEARDRLRAKLRTEGVAADHPAVVAFIGFEGDVRAWWDKYAEALHGEAPPPAWVEAGRISGLPKGLLIYPYWEQGQPVHAHGRSIDPDAKDADKHRHLKAELAGPKRPYYNFKFSRTASGMTGVEGEGDAVSWGQLGWGSVALGSRGSDDVNDMAARVMRGMVSKSRSVLYLVPDNEAAQITGETPEAEATNLRGKAQESLDKFLAFGETVDPRARVVLLPAKDTNAWLVAAKPTSVDTMRVLRAAPTLVEVLATRAGDETREDTRDLDYHRAFAAIAQLDKRDVELMREKLTAQMGLKVTQFRAMLKATQEQADGEAEQEDGKEHETPEILVSNPMLVDDHFLDVVYSPKKDRQHLAVRKPDGTITQLDHITIGPNTYRAGLHPFVHAAASQPLNPNSPPALLFPADVGDKDYTIPQLMARVWSFTMKYLDIPDDRRRICCAYVLLTWLQDCFYDIGYVRALGPFGKGKSRFVMTFGFLAYRAIRAAGLSTLSPMFRLKSLTVGTFVMDEINNPAFPTPPELEMFFNGGTSVFSPPIWRSEGKENVPTAFSDTYGAKIFGAIKEFGDPATNSRCIDTKMTIESARTDIENISTKFVEEAEALRADLMRFRMKHWQPEKQPRTDLLPATLSGRVKQIASALMSIADDDETRANLIAALQERNDEMVSLQADSVTAKIVRAICTIMKEPETTPRNGRPHRDLRMQRLYEMVREQVFDQEDAAPALLATGEKNTSSPRNDPKHWINRSFSARRIGEMVRVELGIKTELASWSTAKPRVAVLSDADWPRLHQLMALYGVAEADLAPAQTGLETALPDAQPLTEAPPPPTNFDPSTDEYFAGLAEE